MYILPWMNVTTKKKHLHFNNFVKLIEESNMSEVLGSFPLILQHYLLSIKTW